MNMESVKLFSQKLKDNINKVIVGKEQIIDNLAITLVCSGHALLEDMPGTGKTLLAKSLAASMACDFKRVQFTPDLLPSDLTGINFYNQKAGEFVFNQGPIFTNILLADEINRATPRTQSSLLECMEEKQVTVDGETRKLQEPFMVIATQNPVETLGTFPLPEAQLDRFLMKLNMGYPSTEEGIEILKRFRENSPLNEMDAVINGEDVLAIRDQVKKVYVSDELYDYIIRLAEATRKNREILLGVSPRGTQALLKAAQALAAFSGRDYLLPDDVKQLAIPVLAHRIIVSGAGFEKNKAVLMIKNLLDEIPAPTEKIPVV